MSSERRNDQRPLALRLKGVAKVYPSFARPVDRLRQILVGNRRRLYQEFWALHPIDLEIERGEVVGIVGHNGAGKSTLLQIIAGTLPPSHGERFVGGRLSALLELGAGFNPEFTGRENTFLAASLLGMSRGEIEDRFPEIVAFSGLEGFIDQPVKTYSSGMFVRLAFSVAVSVDPDVLVVDEALSVGDGAFARRSFDRILRFREQGKTILFCSHSLFQIESLCTQAIWLDRGRVQQRGSPAEVTAAYQAHLDRITAGSPSAHTAESRPAPLSRTRGHARISALELFRDGQKDIATAVRSGQSEIEVLIGFESDAELPTPHAAVTINAPDGRILASAGTWIDGTTLARDANGRGQARVRFPRLALLKGDYSVSAYLFCERGLHIYSAAEQFASFTVVQNHLEQGIVSLAHEWSFLAEGTPESARPHDETERIELPGDWSDRWSVRWSQPSDFASLQALFFQAFTKDMGRDLWSWKYAGASTWGIVASRDEQLVAFFGGMPRRVSHGGRSELAVQIGDVMVAPQERGTLSRQGPLYRVAAAYFQNMQRLYPEVRFAFGFPSLRHLRLGVRLGLYSEVDEITQLAWDSLPPRRSYSVRAREIGLTAGSKEAVRIDKLWGEMQRDWPDLILPIRDAAHWIRRYVEHPEQRYRILILTHRWTRRPLAAVALRLHADFLEWLDYVGPRAGLAEAVRVLRTFAGAVQLQRVQGWFSSAPAESLTAEAVAEPAGVRIPVNAIGTVDAGRLPGRLWLMAGDTDFR